MYMTWEQKMEALIALDYDTSVHMRFPGNWYVKQRNVEIKSGGCLGGGIGNGSTPEEAVNDYWRSHVLELKPEQYLVIDAYKPTRKAMKWNGFMWASVVEEIYENQGK